MNDLTCDSANSESFREEAGWQAWFLTFHEIPPSTRSHAPQSLPAAAGQPSLILFSLGGLRSRVADASGWASEGASLDGWRHDKPTSRKE
jgi:hypothetical protein